MKEMEKLKNGLDQLFEFETEQEEIEHGASMLSLGILRELKAFMKSKGINKAMLAKDLGTTRSYITQLFTGDKLVNAKLLYRLEKAYGFKFEFGMRWPLEGQSQSSFSQMALPEENRSKEIVRPVFVLVPTHPDTISFEQWYGSNRTGSTSDRN